MKKPATRPRSRSGTIVCRIVLTDAAARIDAAADHEHQHEREREEREVGERREREAAGHRGAGDHAAEAADRRAAREIERARERAGARRREQEAQRLRPAAVDVLRVDRHQRRIRADRPRQRPRPAAASRAPARSRRRSETPRPSFDQKPPSHGTGPGSCAQRMRPIATITATNDSALSAKHTASLTTASSSPASAGPIDPRGVDEERVERDRVRQVGAIVDQVHPQRLAQRHVERVRRCRATSARTIRCQTAMCPDHGERREHDGLQQHQRLRDAAARGGGGRGRRRRRRTCRSARMPTLAQNATTPSSQTEPESR